MAVVKLQWSNLLKMTELDFRPDFPASLNISDEVLQVISWLTATTGFDRRLLRCTPQGALLTAKAWSMMHILNAYEIYPEPGSQQTQILAAGHDGVLIATSTQIVTIGFTRVSGGVIETVYVPPGRYYFYPYSCYSVIATVVPSATGTASYIGITTFSK